MLVVGAGQNQYNLYNSLRFRANASAYLNRTPASAGNRTTWTWSAWVKRGSLSVQQAVFFAGNVGTGSNYTNITFNSDNTLTFENVVSAVGAPTLITTQVFRDPSAWYHIVAVYDSTQATSSNRAKLYINGTQVTAFGTATYPSLNQTSFVNSTEAHLIGASRGPANYFDGYLAEVNFIDGQALPPTAFATLNPATGVGTPLKYAGTYGTNGFYLPFSDTSALTTSSNVGLGKDFSGNGNYWATNNISITAGTTYDAMTDVPTNTSPTVGNYCTLNPLYNSTSTISNANLRVATTLGTGGLVIGTIGGLTSGKYYWEATIDSQTFNPSNTTAVGIVRTLYSRSTDYLETINGDVFFGNTASNGDIYGVAADFDSGSITFYKNNTSVSTQSFTANLGWFPGFSDEHGNQTVTLSVNFGQRPFAYTPPSGYNRLNTFNLPDSAIVQGNKVMDATLYTGTGALQNIVNAGTFQPDFVWMKGRSNVRNNNLYDSVRGTTKELTSNTNGVETTNATGLTAFNSNGWTIGSDGGINTSSETYVGWQWQAGKGSTSSNTQGSITSTVSVNASAGFSVVTWTGNGGASTIGHGLGIAPKFIIVRTRNYPNNWFCYHGSLANTEVMYLDTTGAKDTSRTDWNSTSPTSSVFSVNGSNTNRSAINMVAYCWAEISGYSKFGSYTGNGSTDGPFVYTGFRPKFVMIKCTSNADSWYMLDTSRSTYNATNQRLFANASSAESSGDAMDILSNGFKNRSSTTLNNLNGGTYIYMAFAENPFKNALAR